VARPWVGENQWSGPEWLVTERGWGGSDKGKAEKECSSQTHCRLQLLSKDRNHQARS
jgi:hypothetical protein